MRKNAHIVQPGVMLDGDQLLAQQRLATRHFSFAITQACPLHCEHCLVSTVSVGEIDAHSMSIEQAQAYGAQMADLKHLGIERISVTGGEPLLLIEQVRLLAEGAQAAGIESTVVTACHWAKTVSNARDVACYLRAVNRWHLSTDRFHEKYLPIQHVRNAIEGLQKFAVETGNSAPDIMIRIAADSPLSDEDYAFLDRVMDVLPNNVAVAMQPVSPIGRAKRLELGSHSEIGYLNIPCMSTGPLVRYDGSVSPCCSSLMDQRENHPFTYPPAYDVGLKAVYWAWERDRLLRLVRSIGFQPIMQWIRETVPSHPLLLRNLPTHPCDLCVAIWSDAKTTQIIDEFLDQDGVAEKIDQLYATLFGEEA